MIAKGCDREIARLRVRNQQLAEALADMERENLQLERELDRERDHSRTMASVLRRVEARLSEFMVGDVAA